MPIYEYQCEQCGKLTEVIQKFSDAPLTECSHCGGHVTKILSTSAFHLKGGGWYKTDYASSDSGKKSSSDSGSGGCSSGACGSSNC